MSKIILAILTLLLSTNLYSKIPNLIMVTDLSTNKRVWKEVIQGAELAVSLIRKRGKKILFSKINSGARTFGTRNAMNQVIKKNGVDIIILDIDSSKAEIAAEIAEFHQIAAITPYATSPIITRNRKYVFRACVSDSGIAKMLAKMIYQKGIKRIATIYDAGQLYSVTLNKEFIKHYINLGGKIIYKNSILDSSLNYQKIAKEILKSKAQALFLPFYEETVRRFLVDAVKVKNFQKLQIFGSDGWASGNFFLNQKNLVSQMKGVWLAHHNPNPTNKLEKKFLYEYERKYKSAPVTSAAYLGYDSVMLSYEALTKSKGGSPAEKLKNYKKYKGVTGNIKFNNFNEPLKSLYILEYDNGKIQVNGKIE